LGNFQSQFSGDSLSLSLSLSLIPIRIAAAAAAAAAVEASHKYTHSLEESEVFSGHPDSCFACLLLLLCCKNTHPHFHLSSSMVRFTSSHLCVGGAVIRRGASDNLG
jgi:hypothetical protein